MNAVEDEATLRALQGLKDRAERRKTEQDEWNEALKPVYAQSDTTYTELGQGTVANQRFLSNTSIVPGQQIAADTLPGQIVGTTVPKVVPQPPQRRRLLARTKELFVVHRNGQDDIYLRQGNTTTLLLSFTGFSLLPPNQAYFNETAGSVQQVGETYKLNDTYPNNNVLSSRFEARFIYITFSLYLEDSNSLDTVFTLSGQGSENTNVVNPPASPEVVSGFNFNPLVPIFNRTEVVVGATNTKIEVESFSTSQITGGASGGEGPDKYLMIYGRLVPLGGGSASGLVEGFTSHYYSRVGWYGFISLASNGDLIITLMNPGEIYYGSPSTVKDSPVNTWFLEAGNPFIEPQEHMPHPNDWRSHVSQRGYWSERKASPPVELNAETWGQNPVANIQGNTLTLVTDTELQTPLTRLSLQALKEAPIKVNIESYRLDTSGEGTLINKTRTVIPQIDPASFDVEPDDLVVLAAIGL